MRMDIASSGHWQDPTHLGLRFQTLSKLVWRASIKHSPTSRKPFRLRAAPSASPHHNPRRPRLPSTPLPPHAMPPVTPMPLPLDQPSSNQPRLGNPPPAPPPAIRSANKVTLTQVAKGGKVLATENYPTLITLINTKLAEVLIKEKPTNDRAIKIRLVHRHPSNNLVIYTTTAAHADALRDLLEHRYLQLSILNIMKTDLVFFLNFFFVPIMKSYFVPGVRKPGFILSDPHRISGGKNPLGLAARMMLPL